MSCGRLDGRGVWVEWIYVYIYITKSLCCLPETIITLLIILQYKKSKAKKQKKKKKQYGCKQLRSWEPEQSFWQLHESGESKISVNCPVSRKSLGEYPRLSADAVGGLHLN